MGEGRGVPGCATAFSPHSALEGQLPAALINVLLVEGAQEDGPNGRAAGQDSGLEVALVGDTREQGCRSHHLPPARYSSP